MILLLLEQKIKETMQNPTESYFAMVFILLSKYTSDINYIFFLQTLCIHKIQNLVERKSQMFYWERRILRLYLHKNVN